MWFQNEFFTHLIVFANPTRQGFFVAEKLIKMRKQSQTTPIKPNIIAMLSTPSYQVDPIIEIQSFYNVNRDTACDIYETIGDNYTDENLVANRFGIATPSYIATLKGGLSC